MKEIWKGIFSLILFIVGVVLIIVMLPFSSEAQVDTIPEEVFGTEIFSGDSIGCGEVYFFNEDGGSPSYFFNTRNIYCNEQEIRLYVVTMNVPDGVRVFGDGVLLSGGIAVPNNITFPIPGYQLADGPIEVNGPGTYTVIDPFPPIGWPLVSQYPTGSMSVVSDVTGITDIQIEISGNSDASTVFWVYIECPGGEEGYEHPLVEIVNETCTNEIELVYSDTTLILDSCADTMIIERVVYNSYDPVLEKEACVGDEVYLDPYLDLFIPIGSYEWEDGDMADFKAVEVYADTSVGFYYQTNIDFMECNFYVEYDIYVDERVDILFDTIVVYEGEYVKYSPSDSGFGYALDIEPTTDMNKISDDLYGYVADNDVSFQFIYDVNGRGCEYVVYLYIDVINIGMYIPNIFRPDSDNAENIVFQPRFTDGSNVTEYSFTIYDRWGEELYFVVNGSWDGSFNGRELDPSVFAYVLYATLEDGSEHRFAGDVTLIR